MMGYRNFLLGSLLVMGAGASLMAQSPEEQWFGSEAFSLSRIRGKTPAISLWRAPESERSELRILMEGEDQPAEVTAVKLWIAGRYVAVGCSGVRSDFVDSEEFRTSFSSFSRISSVTTLSRCALDWETSLRLLDSENLEVQIDSELGLFRRKRLSKNQLTKLRRLAPL